MFPVLFHIGSFEVTSFGVMVALGALAGLWIFRRELDLRGLPDSATDGAIAGVIGGLIGAKLLWVAEHYGDDTLTTLLFSRGGLSWFGGFVGGVGCALAYFLIRRLPLVTTISAATPGLAAGHAIGRVGCLLVGDDYGRPTSLPWGIAFPRGLPPTTDRVHPTQIYEAALLAILTWALLRWRRAAIADRIVLGRYLLLAGAIRFAIEFVRVDRRVLFGLSVAHIASIGVMLAGAWFLLPARRPALVSGETPGP
jgi:phosphatidylglycerol:prolipoprotein diacylglycerol transferase